VSIAIAVLLACAVTAMVIEGIQRARVAPAIPFLAASLRIE
jgi:hypothetical protein